MKNIKRRAAALVGSVALLGGAAWMAAGTTGAYFSDTHNGSVSGTVGSIKVSVKGNGTGTDGQDLSFSNLLPGQAQSVTLQYGNTGRNAEDVYITFPNATALSALDDLGRYGEVHITANGNHIFDSANLSDAGNPADYSNATPISRWPLLSQYKVASNVQPGQYGTVTFSFNYSTGLSNASNIDAITGPAFNTYPAADGQTYTNASDGTGSGLPYAIVATQVGVIPGATGYPTPSN
ncbi:hypothetical protein [Frondihabitans australicus]|uniref:Camelysin-like metallo-endopeptidase n=1 Tax=Frondihabitans australicus TaxID=386892 RepID=A0A495ID23_9MICO|nr:hypothetical protein [Frondihabitans australicus]RKR73358.1 hypothetical protein C8E83_0450 [Frondihabitans australicus]